MSQTNLRCPACGQTGFASRNGLSRHMNLMHKGESLVSFSGPRMWSDQRNNATTKPLEEEVNPQFQDMLTRYLAVDTQTAKSSSQSQDAFPVHSDSDEEESEIPVGGPERDPKVEVGDSTPLHPFLKQNSFVPPDGFSGTYLQSVVDEPGHVGYKYKEWDRLSASEKSEIHLLKLLKGKDLYLFDLIQKWRYKSDLEYGDKIDNRTDPPSRSKAIKGIQKAYGYDALAPIKKEVRLPHTGVATSLIVFPFGEMLMSLLTDPVAMQSQNLYIDPEDPFAEPKLGGSNNSFSDFHTGSVHRAAHKQYCSHPRDILCEILIFLDKTHIDTKSKHTLEPIMFCPGIFNSSYRNNHNAWRPLGYIPNMDALAPHCTADQKQKDYHLCVRVIMSELVAYQRLGGIDWAFVLDGKEINCRLQIPITFVMGDTEGHDKLCARKQVRSQGRLCRYCDVPFELLGKPLEASNRKLTKCGTIRKWRNSPEVNKERLSDLGYKLFHDGFVDVHFSDPVRGLHGCTPAEILHAYQLGLAERSIESCFGAKRAATGRKLRRNASKRRKISDEVVSPDVEEYHSDEDGRHLDSYIEEESREGTVMEAVSVNEITNVNVFNDDAKKRVDGLAIRIHRYLKWQSDKGLPRTNFPRGITSLSKMQGNERTGVLLILLVVLVIDYWADWRASSPKTRDGGKPGYLKHALSKGDMNSSTNQRFNNMVKSIFLLLTFQAYMSLEEIPRQTLKKVEQFVPLFLDQVLRTFPRSTGAGNNLIKNHVFLHLCEDIERFGSCRNYDSGIGESLHIPVAKETGRKTNMNSKKFEEQTGNRYVENLSVNRAFADHPDWREPTKIGNRSSDFPASARIVTIASDYLVGRNNKKIRGSIPNWFDSYCSSQEVIDLVRNQILPRLASTSQISIYTKFVFEDTVYAASPCYGEEGLSKQDWALVDMGDDGTVPNHLLCVLFIPEKPIEDIILNNLVVADKGFFFLTHSAHCPLTDEGPSPYEGENLNEGTRAHADQHLIHRIPKSHLVQETGKWIYADKQHAPSLLLIPCSSLVGPCIGFPDLDSPSSDTDFFFLRETEAWAELFQDYARKS